jgi:ParB family chromosome partitioning protein
MKGLGRGFESLIPTDLVDDEFDPTATEDKKSSDLKELKLEDIIRDEEQPRRDFDEDALNDLAESIKQIGVIQPITLRKVADHKYQIIAGERRFRASQLAEMKSIPAYVREATDEQMAEMALVENIQREDLNAIEIALSYKNLMSLCNYTQDQLSERVGKNRATIANYVRLLSLPAEIQLGLKEKKIDMGHARGLLQAKNSVDQLKIYEEILKNGLSVRKVEEMARNMNLGNEVTQSEPKKTKKEEVPEEYGVMQERLSSLFGTNVDLSVNAKGKGKISIPFKNDDELAKIMEVLDSMGSNSEIN